MSSESHFNILFFVHSGSYPALKITWYIFGIYRQKRLYKSYKDTQVSICLFMKSKDEYYYE